MNDLNSTHENLRNALSDYFYLILIPQWFLVIDCFECRIIECFTTLNVAEKFSYGKHSNRVLLDALREEKYCVLQAVLLTHFAGSVAKKQSIAKSLLILELFLFTIHLSEINFALES